MTARAQAAPALPAPIATRAAALAVCVGLSAGGCGDFGGSFGSGSADAGGDGSEEIEGLESLDIAPEGPVLVIDDGEPASATFEAIGQFDDGRTEDLSDRAQFSLDDTALGSFSGSTLETGTRRGGHTRATARIGSVQASTDVTIIARARHRDPEADLPADHEDLFDGAADAEELSPELVYPEPEVLLPPNLDRFELHLVPSGGAELFELSFSSDTTDVVVYTTCTEPLGGGCIYTPTASLWQTVAQSNRGGSVTVEVRAADEGEGGVGAAPPQSIDFSEDEIRGAIYYWTTSDIIEEGQSTAIMRYDFAGSQTEPEIFIDPSDADGNCVGCHSLSPDGSKMFTAAGDDGGQVLLTDVRTGEPLVPFDSTPRSAYAAWSPSGDRFAGTYSLEDSDNQGDLTTNLNLFAGDTGQHLETLDLGGSAEQPISQPDWSPTGDQIAFIQMGAMGGSGTHAFAVQASVGIIDREGDGWSDERFLTDPPAGENTFFPAFNPDGDLLAYNHSSCPGDENTSDCYAHMDENATLLVTEPEQGAEHIPLDRANAPGAMDDADVVMNSFPKWTPFTFEGTEEFGGRLHWISFSSDRRYGLREPGDQDSDFVPSLIWMAAIDPDRALAGEDPSRPAFALPFQALDTNNHTAQWTETTVIIE